MTPLEIIGRYQIVGQLATGGMAEVLLGKLVGPSSFERAVVIKRILPHLARQPSFVRMFLDEARIAAGIRHANVVDVHDLGQHGEQLFLVMEYLEGETTNGLLRRLAAKTSVLDPFLCAHVIAEACAGLHAAHELTDVDGRSQNLVHRDVSPQNIFLTYDGQVKILDFGIAKVEDRASRTDAGLRKGRWAYMSPEQVRGEALDRRSDIFSLGAVLYELSTSHRLFSKNSQDAAARALHVEPVIAPSRVVAGYPAWLEQIVLRALEPRREDRFQTCAEMRRQLLVAIHPSAPPEGWGETLAGVMRVVFADRMAEKKEMLRRVRSGGRVVPVPHGDAGLPDEIPVVVDDGSLPSGTTLTPMSVEMPPSAPLPPGLDSPRRGRVKWVIATVAFVAAVAVAFWWTAGRPMLAGPHRPSRARPVAKVAVRVETSPAGATVVVGGRERGRTPLDLRLDKSNRPTRMILRLDGHRERTETVQPDANRRLRFDLEPAAPAPPPPAAPPPAAPPPVP